MDSISLQKLHALMRSLERIHSCPSLQEFSTSVFGALADLIPGGFFSLETINLESGEVMSATSESSLKRR